jgi:hypothetical protein
MCRTIPAKALNAILKCTASSKFCLFLIIRNSDCKELSLLCFSRSNLPSRISLLSYCRITRVTALLPPSPITSSCHVLARSTMFFCAILYRRQIWIVECSCRARNWQLQWWWAPKGLHRIHIEHQQLPSLSSLKGIRQNWFRLRSEILPLFVANVHIRMHTYYEIIYTRY